jgi:diguanylate cyclase (GGDEF)-like protein
VASTTSSADRAPAVAPVAQAVRLLWERLRGPILARVDVLEDAALALLEGSLKPELRARAAREAHKLAGAAGTFGFPGSSERAREAELILHGDAPIPPPRVLHLTDIVVAIRRELEAEARTAGDGGREEAEDGERRPTLTVLGASAAFLDSLAVEASLRGFRISADEPAPGRREAPAAVLLDLSSHASPETALDRFADVALVTPVVVLGPAASLDVRLNALRRGAIAYLGLPQTEVAIMDHVEQALARRSLRGSAVLVVMDDPVLLALTEAVLSMAGARVETLNDPREFWTVLLATNPDLVLLDRDMPGVSGVELCRMVRGDARWGSLPVIFLTGDDRTEVLSDLLACGGDDYVLKPMDGTQLVERVASRLARLRTQQALATVDTLTQVLTRSRAQDDALRLLRLAVRQADPFSIGIVAVDRLSEINERWGPDAGDEVLRRVARRLRSALRTEDVVGRWSGDEFILGMYGMQKVDATYRLPDILARLREEGVTLPDGRCIPITFTGGIAEYPADGESVPSLCLTAENTLRQARAAGRDRFLAAGWDPASSNHTERVDVLVVDDDPVLARLLVHTLEGRGYRCRWVSDGREALDAMTGNPPKVKARVVLLDVDLPGLDGHAVLRGLADAKLLGRTKVLMLTVRSHESEVVRSLSQGAFDHIAKPFSIPVLLQRIQRGLSA